MSKSKLARKEVISHFRKVSPKLAEIIQDIDMNQWFKVEGNSEQDLFASLCRTIAGQQLGIGAATAIFGRFKVLLNDVLTPESVLSKTDSDFRAVGFSWAKARSVLDLASKVQMQEVRLSKLAQLDDETVVSELIKVKGIGRWTAEMFMMFRLGRENVFSYGDLGLKNGLKKFLGKSDLDESEIQKVVETWSPYKSYGSIAMWHLLDNGNMA